MLRISEAAGDPKVTLKVEGRLAGPWVQELRTIVEVWRGRKRPLCVDIAGVSFADGEGVRLLNDLRVNEVTVYGASRFVAELLGGDRR